MITTLLAVTLGAGEPLGAPLIQDGYQLRPPLGFFMVRMHVFRGTKALAIGLGPAAVRSLSAALVDGEGEDAASMAIAVTEAPLTLGPTARDDVSTAVLRHFRDELGVALSLERAQVHGGPASRVEVLGTIRQGSQLRRVLVAAFPGDLRHVVVVCSVPAARWEALHSALAASLDSLRLEAGSAGLPRAWRWALVAITAVAMLASLALWVWRRVGRVVA